MKKEKKYGLLKGIILLILIAVVLTWFIPTGDYSQTASYVDGGMIRVGLNDLSWILYTGMYISIDKIMFLFIIGGFYGVLTRTNAYERLVSGIAKKLSKHKQASVVVLSTIIAILTSFLNQTFAVLIFIPFIVSILKRMKLDKMTIMATTFGSMLVGVLGATFGTEGLGSLNEQFIGETLTAHSLIIKTLLIRMGILVIGLILFNFFTLSHMSKQNEEDGCEIFEVTTTESTKKASIIPIVIVGVILLILVILGCIDWSTNFNLEIFNDFHDILKEIHIGDFYIFSSLLGPDMKALGSWDLFCLAPIVALATALIGICYRVKFNDFIANVARGIKKMIKPAFVVVGAFTLLSVVYTSPYISTIGNKLLGLTDGFNLATMTLTTFISNIFHADLGFSGYIFGAYFVTEYIDFINPIYVMMISLYGLVQFFIPTGILMGIGLTTLNVRYRDWLKHIWKFVLGMLICLLIIFVLITLL